MKKLSLLIATVFAYLIVSADGNLPDVIKIIPAHPTENDVVKFVVAESHRQTEYCQNFKLDIESQKDNVFNVSGSYDSQVKCLSIVDTITLGKLPKGKYTINYAHIDITLNPEFRAPTQYKEITFEVVEKQNLSSVPETTTIQFSISPNPAGESFEIKVDDIENIASISLFDEVGKLVKRLPIENTISVDCAGLTSGVYVCQIIDKQGVATTKQVIVK